MAGQQRPLQTNFRNWCLPQATNLCSVAQHGLLKFRGHEKRPLGSFFKSHFLTAVALVVLAKYGRPVDGSVVNRRDVQ